MLAPVRTIAPAETPVSLAEAKAHLRVEHSDDDALITGLIAAATDHLDGWSGVLGRCLVTQTWRQDFAGFADCLRLPLGPVASITSVTYLDGDNAEQTLPDTDYQLLTDALGALVALAPGRSWPATCARPDAVSVTFVAGSAADDVPPALKVAIMLLVGHWYERREAIDGNTLAELPFSVSALIAPYRRIGV
jgi:uncharacterized phiE125 gp8 family phage protein